MLFQLLMATVLAQPLQFVQTDATTNKDSVLEVLEKLQKTIEISGNPPLGKFSEMIESKSGVPVVINESAFREQGVEDPLVLSIKLTRSKSRLSSLLKMALAQHQACYLVHRDHIEIVPIAFANSEVGLPAEDENPIRLKQPLISAIFREKPLNEALAEIAENFDLTIIVSPQSGDSKTAFVNARLLNVPADHAIDMLAIQADLRVMQKGKAFVVTSRDHANDLFTEKLEREQRIVEIERLRWQPVTPQLGMGGFGGVGIGQGGIRQPPTPVPVPQVPMGGAIPTSPNK